MSSHGAYQASLGQSCRTGTMHFLKGELEVLALFIFLKIGLNFFVFHIKHLILGNPNFRLISMTHHCVRKKLGFSSLFQQEMFKVVDIGI